MAYAEICPICEGSGTVGWEVTCHGCDGKGWVEVGAEYPDEDEKKRLRESSETVYPWNKWL